MPFYVTNRPGTYRRQHGSLARGCWDVVLDVGSNRALLFISVCLAKPRLYVSISALGQLELSLCDVRLVNDLV